MPFSLLKLHRSIYVVLLITCAVFSEKGHSQNPGISASFQDSSIYQADPTIFLYKGLYYLYGTNSRAADKGIRVFISSNLKTWQTAKTFYPEGYALKKPESFGTAGFWAPQVLYDNNKFYMAYVANEHIAIAQSDSPMGPFIAKNPLSFEQKNIDPFIFTDDDGKKYLFHVDISEGNRIFVAELNDELSAIKPSTNKLCISATEIWETKKDHVVEGPTVIKHNGLYYLIYSANNFISPYYAVGYATSSKVYGPWKKNESNPILSIKNTGESGSGHGDIFFDKNNRMYYVFHTHYSDTSVSPRRTAIARAFFVKGSAAGPDKLVIDGKHFFYLKKTN